MLTEPVSCRSARVHVFFFGSSLGLVADAVALSEAGCVLDSLELVTSKAEKTSEAG